MRTETISAFTEGNRQLYQEAGVKQLQFWAAKDEKELKNVFQNMGENMIFDPKGDSEARKLGVLGWQFWRVKVQG